MMQARVSDAFALRNSGFDAFLHADVGTELNGSALTILSMIARFGRDPWAEVARWAALPRAGVIDGLVQSIAQMPLVPSALAEALVTAERLAQLPMRAPLLDGRRRPEWTMRRRRAPEPIHLCQVCALRAGPEAGSFSSPCSVA